MLFENDSQTSSLICPERCSSRASCSFSRKSSWLISVRGDARDGELHRQTTLGGQVVERWDQLRRVRSPEAPMTMTPARGRGAAAARPLSYQRSAFSPQLSASL